MFSRCIQEAQDLEDLSWFLYIFKPKNTQALTDSSQNPPPQHIIATCNNNICRKHEIQFSVWKTKIDVEICFFLGSWRDKHIPGTFHPWQEIEKKKTKLPNYTFNADKVSGALPKKISHALEKFSQETNVVLHILCEECTSIFNR